MFSDLKDRITIYRQKNPEAFRRRISKLAIGICVPVLLIVAFVNVASVLTVFPAAPVFFI